jgi:transcriptional regulator with XRE-family HTH domain
MQNLVARQNTEFLRLFNKSGWSEAKTAQELGLTSDLLNQYLAGSARPKPTVIRLFKLLLGDLQPFDDEGHYDNALLPLQAWEIDVLRELRNYPLDYRRKVMGGLAKVVTIMARSNKPKKG